MKCIKFTYETPLTASVYCEELLQDEPDNRIHLDTVNTARFIDDTDITQFLEEHVTDLTEHIPPELKDLVVKAVFGKFEIRDIPYDADAYLLTEIYVRREPSMAEGVLMEEWVTGQLSDGWGESFEQEECSEDRIKYTKPEFDYTTFGFEEVYEYADVYWYLHPWNNDDNWHLSLHSKEEVELDIPADKPVVYGATCNLEEDHYIVRTVYQFEDIRVAIACIRNSGCLYSEEFIQWMERDGSNIPNARFYIVCVNEGMFTQFLPMLGVFRTDAKITELYTQEAESGSILVENFSETEHKEFRNELLNR